MRRRFFKIEDPDFLEIAIILTHTIMIHLALVIVSPKFSDTSMSL